MLSDLSLENFHFLDVIIFFLRASITIDYMYAKHCGEGKIGVENESELRVYN